MANLSSDQVIILGLLVGIPALVFLLFALAFIGKNIEGWGRSLYNWLNARKTGLAIFGLIFMLGVGLFLWGFWTDNIGLRGIIWVIVPIAFFFLVLYLMAHRQIPKPKYLK